MAAAVVMLAPEDIVSVREIADRCGVTSPAVGNWKNRHIDFPAPYVQLSFGPIWLWPQVEPWLRAHGKLALDTVRSVR